MDSANTFKGVVLGIERLTIRRESPLPLWGLSLINFQTFMKCRKEGMEWEQEEYFIPIVNT